MVQSTLSRTFLVPSAFQVTSLINLFSISSHTISNFHYLEHLYWSPWRFYPGISNFFIAWAFTAGNCYEIFMKLLTSWKIEWYTNFFLHFKDIFCLSMSKFFLRIYIFQVFFVSCCSLKASALKATWKILQLNYSILSPLFCCRQCNVLMQWFESQKKSFENVEIWKFIFLWSFVWSVSIYCLCNMMLVKQKLNIKTVG